MNFLQRQKSANKEKVSSSSQTDPDERNDRSFPPSKFVSKHSAQGPKKKIPEMTYSRPSIDYLATKLKNQLSVAAEIFTSAGFPRYPLVPYSLELGVFKDEASWISRLWRFWMKCMSKFSGAAVRGDLVVSRWFSDIRNCNGRTIVGLPLRPLRISHFSRWEVIR